MDEQNELKDNEKWTLVLDKHSQSQDAILSNRSALKTDDDPDTDGISVISEEDIDMVDNGNNQTNITIEKDDHQQHQDIPAAVIPENQSNQNNAPQLPLKKNPSTGDFDFYCYSGMRTDEELNDDYFAPGTKVRSYIHKRNNRVSGMLNMILFGTILITACLAIGHIWGTTDDCSSEMAHSLSELLYNMQELQHENYILKLKLKEMESIKNDSDTLPFLLYQVHEIQPEDPLKNNIIEQTFDFLQQEKSSCQCAENTNDKVVEKVADDNIDKAEVTNETTEKIEIEKPRSKRSIGGSNQNHAFIGPKNYKDQIDYKLKRYYKNDGKYLYPSKGNLSNVNNKKFIKENKEYLSDNFKVGTDQFTKKESQFVKYKKENYKKNKYDRKYDGIKEWQEKRNKFAQRQNGEKGKKHYDENNLKHNKNKPKKHAKQQKSEFAS